MRACTGNRPETTPTPRRLMLNRLVSHTSESATRMFLDRLRQRLRMRRVSQQAHNDALQSPCAARCEVRWRLLPTVRNRSIMASVSAMLWPGRAAARLVQRAGHQRCTPVGGGLVNLVKTKTGRADHRRRVPSPQLLRPPHGTAALPHTARWAKNTGDSGTLPPDTR